MARFNKTKLIDDMSMVSSAHSVARILAVRAVETVSGQRTLKRLYQNYQQRNLPIEDFWDNVFPSFDIEMNFHGTDPNNVPQKGALIVVANHPFGVLDGLALCCLVARRRMDFKILINEILTRVPEIGAHGLPVSFDKTKEALATNLASRKQSYETLESGGVVIVFPSGHISTTGSFFELTASDREWGSLVGKLVRKTGASVLPVYFGGQNSQLFQKLSHISGALRWALMFHEARRRRGTVLDMIVGAPLNFNAPSFDDGGSDDAGLADITSDLAPKELAAFLKTHTLALGEKLEN